MLTALAAVAAIAQSGQDWTLHYERSGYLETGRYQEAVDYCRRLDRASDSARAFTFGKSPEGRDMVALLISSERALSPRAIRRSRRPLIVVQNGIHSGEIEGKDASLMLARDLLIHRKHRALLDGANILIVPVFSVDAHERFGPYNRINQNGPREMGWRATAQNLNLNRDYVKADAGEMRALLGLLRDYRPDFFFDNHTTNGADYQYTVTLAFPMAPTLDPALAAWSRSAYEDVRGLLDANGFLTAPYFSLVDRTDPTKGISVGDYSPRFSIGYMAAINRPSVLVETHMLKPYRPRVEGTYWTMVHTIGLCVRDAARLKAWNRAADESGRAAKEGTQVVLSATTAAATRPFTFKGFEVAILQSPISGSAVPRWDRTKPRDYPSTVRDQYEPGLTVTLPAAYAIPPQWTAALEVVRLHGLESFTLRRPMEGDFQTFRFSDVTFPKTPFESRFQPSFKARPITERRTLPAGTVILPVGQTGAKLLAHLMEPEAPDSLLRWGFFNAIFESKEYAEDYAMEPIAAEMLKADPRLRAEFEERLKDESFAKDPRARLQFFYERSPYWDVRLNKYPLVRLTTAQFEASQRSAKG